jgi:hypothetical protein
MDAWYLFCKASVFNEESHISENDLDNENQNDLPGAPRNTILLLNGATLNLFIIVISTFFGVKKH